MNIDKEFILKGMELLEIASDKQSKLNKKDIEQIKEVLKVLNDIKERL